MKDVTGKELVIGDKIVLIPQNGYTMSLSMGIVTGFTKQKVKFHSQISAGLIQPMSV
jgi:hypothetical protein